MGLGARDVPALQGGVQRKYVTTPKGWLGGDDTAGSGSLTMEHRTRDGSRADRA